MKSEGEQVLMRPWGRDVKSGTSHCSRMKSEKEEEEEEEEEERMTERKSRTWTDLGPEEGRRRGNGDDGERGVGERERER